jgi:hypothetical protein
VRLSALSARPIPGHPVSDDDDSELDELEAKQITCESPGCGLDTSGRERFGENRGGLVGLSDLRHTPLCLLPGQRPIRGGGEQFSCRAQDGGDKSPEERTWSLAERTSPPLGRFGRLRRIWYNATRHSFPSVSPLWLAVARAAIPVRVRVRLAMLLTMEVMWVGLGPSKASYRVCGRFRCPAIPRHQFPRTDPDRHKLVAPASHCGLLTLPKTGFLAIQRRFSLPTRVTDHHRQELSHAA